MPSWSLHTKICRELGIEIASNVCYEVNRIIDFECEHDVGRKYTDPFSFEKMIYCLWLEYGDVYKNGKFLRLKTRKEREAWLRQAQLSGEIWYTYMYIPDDVLLAAVLHHILDVLEEIIRSWYPVASREKAPQLIDQAKETLSHIMFKLKGLRPLVAPHISFDKMVEQMIDQLKKRAYEIYNEIISNLQKKGWKPEAGPGIIRTCLLEIIRKENIYGVITVNERPLPVVAAATKIYSELSKGKPVKVTIGPYTLKWRSLSDILEWYLKVTSANKH